MQVLSESTASSRGAAYRLFPSCSRQPCEVKSGGLGMYQMFLSCRPTTCPYVISVSDQITFLALYLVDDLDTNKMLTFSVQHLWGPDMKGSECV